MSAYCECDACARERGLRADLNAARLKVGTLTVERDALRARVAELEREPVAFVVPKPDPPPPE